MKYLRRGIWYLASRLLLICLILAMMITVFYYAMNATNIQIILKDGMAARPSKGRACFTDWNYFNKDAKLVPSGLLGPVTLH